MTRGPAVAAGLLVPLLAVAAHQSLARGSNITVHAVVERSVAVQDPSRAVTWAPVLGLTRDQFEVRVDEQAVAIDSFSTADEPIALVVLVDVSASVEFNRTDLREPLRDFVVPALSPGDVVAFGRFGGTRLYINDRFNAVPDTMRDGVEAALARPRQTAAGPGDVSKDLWGDMNEGFGLGGSPAWDAVYAAVDLLGSQRRRRAILLVTDGRSTANVHSVSEAILYAASNDVSVSVFDEAADMVISQSEMGVARVRPSLFLQPMAERTGGGYAKLFGPWERTPALVDRKGAKRWTGIALAQLVRDLHAAYTLTFISPASDAAAHRLEVRLKTPGLKVRARQAFLAPSVAP